MSEIKVGQRFRDTNPTIFGHAAPEWVVSHVFIGTDGMQYAQIYSESNPHERKTLATATLRDKRRFMQVEVRPAG
jgi:hypothetical protein